jgi:hypothetical protein
MKSAIAALLALVTCSCGRESPREEAFRGQPIAEVPARQQSEASSGEPAAAESKSELDLDDAILATKAGLAEVRGELKELDFFFQCGTGQKIPDTEITFTSDEREELIEAGHDPEEILQLANMIRVESLRMQEKLKRRPELKQKESALESILEVLEQMAREATPASQ